MLDYDVNIGLEIHSELNTTTKAFCGCLNTFGAIPNSQVCPVCLGLPGALPLINRKAVEYTIMAGLALGSTINNLAVFERKNYFYPDLSKSYQISQLDKPLCMGGGLRLSSGKYISFNRIHMEEDAGKLIHSEKDNCSYVDFNRCGVPLIEMVTEPEFTSGDEVVEFLGMLRQTLVHIGVANCKMEEGGFRIDVNVSVKPKSAQKLGTKVELKNINTFKAISQAIEYEKNRQIELIENNMPVLSETRGWNEQENVTYLLRAKESENDYRYFADPSILPIEISDKDIEKISKKLPASLNDVFDKYRDMGLDDNQIQILTNKGLTRVFDKINSIVDDAKEVANWLLIDILKLLKDYGSEQLFKLLPLKDLANVIKLVKDNTITRASGKMLIEKIIESGKSVKQLIIENDLIGDVNKIDVENFVMDIIREKPTIISDYATDKNNVINYFIGQIMKYTGGKARAEYVIPLIKKIIEKELK